MLRNVIMALSGWIWKVSYLRNKRKTCSSQSYYLDYKFRRLNISIIYLIVLYKFWIIRVMIYSMLNFWLCPMKNDFVVHSELWFLWKQFLLTFKSNTISWHSTDILLLVSFIFCILIFSLLIDVVENTWTKTWLLGFIANRDKTMIWIKWNDLFEIKKFCGRIIRTMQQKLSWKLDWYKIYFMAHAI